MSDSDHNFQHPVLNAMWVKPKTISTLMTPIFKWFFKQKSYYKP